MSQPNIHPVRQLGTTAWAVLEVLRQRSVSDDHGDLVVHVSIRSLAVELGLAKNTVHRALRRLRERGLIDAREARTAAGTFWCGHYALTTNRVVDSSRPVVATTASTAVDADPVPSRPVAAAGSGQLTLGI